MMYLPEGQKIQKVFVKGSPTIVIFKLMYDCIVCLTTLSSLKTKMVQIYKDMEKYGCMRYFNKFQIFIYYLCQCFQPVQLYEMYVPLDKKISIRQQYFGGFSYSAFWKHCASDNHILLIALYYFETNSIYHYHSLPIYTYLLP